MNAVTNTAVFSWLRTTVIVMAGFLLLKLLFNIVKVPFISDAVNAA